jgi:hypothetical protein
LGLLNQSKQLLGLAMDVLPSVAIDFWILWWTFPRWFRSWRGHSQKESNHLPLFLTSKKLFVILWFF